LLAAFNNNKMGIVFIYIKDGKIQVLDIDTAKAQNEEMLKNGWEHASTLNACVFLEYLHNDCEKEDVIAGIIELGTKK
jgi:hypothetical protein